jgi:hypothetical protein
MSVPQATPPRLDRRQASGNGTFTPLGTYFPQGASGWLRFFGIVSELFTTAREQHNRTYLSYDEWNVFFKAAVRHGCIDRSNLAGVIEPLAEYSARNPRDLTRFSGRLCQAMIIETFRVVREARARGDSPFQLAQHMRNSALAYDAAQAEKQHRADEAKSRTDDLSGRRRRRESRPEPEIDPEAPLPPDPFSPD